MCFNLHKHEISQNTVLIDLVMCTTHYVRITYMFMLVLFYYFGKQSIIFHVIII